MTFSNFALRYHKDVDHWVIYHLNDVCEMCRRSLNHFSCINVAPCGGIVDVNVNFDMWIARQRQICGWLFLWQNIRVVNLSITHDYLIPSLSFNVSRSSGTSNSNLASMTSNFGLGLRQFDSITAQRLRFLQNMILWVFLLINFNIITWNYCLNKTILILVVVFLLSVSINNVLSMTMNWGFLAPSICVLFSWFYTPPLPLLPFLCRRAW